MKSALEQFGRKLPAYYAALSLLTLPSLGQESSKTGGSSTNLTAAAQETVKVAGSPDYKRWFAYPKNSSGTPPSDPTYKMVYPSGAANRLSGANVSTNKFDGSNEYTGDLLFSLLGDLNQCAQATRTLLPQVLSLQMPLLRTADSLTNVASDAAVVRLDTNFQAAILKLTNAKRESCKEDATTVAACALNEYTRSLKPGESAEIRLEAGLLFLDTLAPAGVGHMWTRIKAPSGEALVDLAFRSGPAEILPVSSRDRIAIAAYFFKIERLPDNTTRITTGQAACLAPPLK